eukprot:m.256205 g.256205  ORF g.256205 m.256205 type:complete len:1083 (+) comp15513_c2_seq10:107-3355(+)
MATSTPTTPVYEPFEPMEVPYSHTLERPTCHQLKHIPMPEDGIDLLKRSHNMVNCTYLGHHPMNAPKSASEVATLTTRAQTKYSTHPSVLLCLPKLFGGHIMVVDESRTELLLVLPIQHIVFCAHPSSDTTVVALTVEKARLEPRLGPGPFKAPSAATSSSPSSQPGTAGAHSPAQSPVPPSSRSISPTQPSREAPAPQVEGGRAGANNSEDAAVDAKTNGVQGAVGDVANKVEETDVATKIEAQGQVNLDEAGSDEGEESDDGASNASGESTPSVPRSASSGVAVAAYCILFQFDTASTSNFALESVGVGFEALHAAAKIKQNHTDAPRHPLHFEASIAFGLGEQDKTSYIFCPFSKGVLKTREKHNRQIYLTLTQLTKHSAFEKICRIGIATPQLGFADLNGCEWLDIVSMEYPDDETCVVVAFWPASETVIDLPQVSGHSGSGAVDGTLAVTFIVEFTAIGLPRSLRTHFDVQLKILPENDRIWIQGKRQALSKQFELRLRSHAKRHGFVSYSQESFRELPTTAKASYLERLNAAMRQTLSDKSQGSAEDASAQKEEQIDGSGDAGAAVDGDDDSTSETPVMLVSGQGHVSSDVDDNVLAVWSSALSTWKTLSPARKLSLAIRGIPDSLRKDVWFRLSNAENPELEQQYPYLLKEQSECEGVIVWDLERTFPANPFFAEKGGEGQQLLYNLNLAYAVFDEEIGYVQGLSFISAVLLLHLPEEMAFLVFVRLMHGYGLRDLYKEGFENLSLRFDQLNQLLRDFVPEVATHFQEIGLETHMYASQWFLTLFATKFSLNFVYRVFDLFFAQGVVTLFQVALGLLRFCKKEIVAREFEDVLSFFRLELPRMLPTEADISAFFRNHVSKIKVTEKKLAKLEAQYFERKAQEAREQDPLQFLERENLKLKEAQQRLEVESNTLTQRLMTMQTQMSDQTHERDERIASLYLENERLRESLADYEPLKQEIDHVKSMYRAADAEVRQLHAEAAEREERHKAQLAFSQKEKGELQARLTKLEAIYDVDQHDSDRVQLQQTIHTLELELAKAKLEVVESNCRAQELEQQVLALKDETSRRRSGFSLFNR